MEFQEYSNGAQKTAIYPRDTPRLEPEIIYTLLGLANETGELLGKVKKIIRDTPQDDFKKESPLFSLLDARPELREQLAAEAGDVLWYLSMFCFEIGVPLGIVAQKNIEKLQSRKDRNVLAGSGDNR